MELKFLGKIGEVQALYVKVCTPNSFFHIGCNRCKCSELGEKYTCTKADCAEHHNQVPHHSHHHHRSVRSGKIPEFLFFRQRRADNLEFQ